MIVIIIIKSNNIKNLIDLIVLNKYSIKFYN